MTALLTDEEITNEAMGHCDNASKLRVDDFEAGARFARDHYEAAMQRELECREKLVASLQNLVAAVCKVQDWDGTRVGSALDDVDAALAAAKEIE